MSTAAPCGRRSRLLEGRLSLAPVALLFLAAWPCLAHDFWIQPSTYRPAPDAPVGVGLRVGAHFTGDALPRDSRLLERFVVVGPGGQDSPVAGVDGVRPAGVLSLSQPGLYVVGYSSHETVAELTPEKLATYIEEEGLRSQLEGAPPPSLVRDAFSRSAKALLRVPGGGSSGYDRRLGLPLELVPLADPHRLLAGKGGETTGSAATGGAEGLPLELLYRGEPLPGVKVFALHHKDPLHPLKGETDGEGRVRLPLDRPGEWLIKAVRIERAPEGAQVTYHSLWASLTFEVDEE